MKTPLKRRTFIGHLAIILALSRCKTEIIKPLKPLSTSKVPPPGPVTSDYLGTYTTTELGVGTFAPPTYFENLTIGYTDNISYHPGDAVTLYLSGPANSNKTIFLKDINNNPVFSFSTPINPQQINSQRPWEEGYMFNKTITVNLPADLKSGVYSWELGTYIHERIPLICKNNIAPSDITVIYPSNTDNAYNIGGGKSLYGPAITNRSTIVSNSRYSIFPGDTTSSFLKWMGSQNYNVNYIADIDVDTYANIQNSRIVIIAGHSEYWTRQARENIDAYVETGKNLLVLSGNTMWWQVRYNQNKNLMICYKDNKLDPLTNTLYSTVQWPTPLLKYPTTSSIGVDWNGGGYANKLPNRWNGFKIVQEKSPLFEGTGLKNGDILNLPSYEVDGAPVVKMILPGSDEIPVIDNSKLNFYKVELLGYDFATGGSNPNGLATFIVFKKTQNSGTVVNVATMNWCSATGIGGTDNIKIQGITKNMIDKSLNNSTLFST